ncbi:MAG TPA: LptF/LptG family permease, partial [Armatimonadota bacterium]|nr:LptF/LptG family permease [Armatimonadota bacterium]
MRLHDRHLLRELGAPFLIGVVTFAVILLGDAARQISDTIINQRTPLSLIAKYIWLRTPNAVVWSLPVGTLLGVSLAIAGMTRDGEITAIRAAGVSFARICMPLVAIGIFGTGIAFALNEWVVPDANDASMRALEEIRVTQAVISEERNQFIRDVDERRIFFVGRMNAHQNLLENVVMWSFDEQDRLISIVHAEFADTEDNVWMLHLGRDQGYDEWGEPLAPVAFDEMEVRLQGALQKHYTDKRTAFEMSAEELRSRVATLEATGRDTHADAVELQFKYSIPAACVVFALIGAPLAFRFSRWGIFGGVLLAILMVFLYNGVRSWTLAFGLAGTLHPIIAGWLQNVLFGGIGILM